MFFFFLITFLFKILKFFQNGSKILIYFFSIYRILLSLLSDTYRFRMHIYSYRYVISVTPRELNANKLKDPEICARQIRDTLELPRDSDFCSWFCSDLQWYHAHLLSALLLSFHLCSCSEGKGSRREYEQRFPVASVWRSREALGALILIRKLWPSEWRHCWLTA